MTHTNKHICQVQIELKRVVRKRTRNQPTVTAMAVGHLEFDIGPRPRSANFVLKRYPYITQAALFYFSTLPIMQGSRENEQN